MRTFLNLPLLDINRNYEMFAHHSFVLPYPLITMCIEKEKTESTIRTNSYFISLRLFKPCMCELFFYDVCVSVKIALFSFTFDVVHFQVGSKDTSVKIYARVGFTEEKEIFQNNMASIHMCQ